MKQELPDGYFFEEDIKVYNDLVLKLPDKACLVEIGCCLGRSICSIANHIINKNLKVIVIDTFLGTEHDKISAELYTENRNIKRELIDNLKRFQIDSFVSIIQATSEKACSTFENESIDFVFIDADHSYPAVLQDIKLWNKKIKINGIIAGHDYHFGAVKQAVRDNLGRAYLYNKNIWFKKKSPVVYDCFTFFNEVDLLEVRLQELNDVVDYFVIVESTKTYTNKDKELNFKKYEARFKNYSSKIIYTVMEDFPLLVNDEWYLEPYQRNYIERVLKDRCKASDIIINTDMDEIPRAESVKEYRGDVPKLLHQNFFHYYLNGKINSIWDRGIILPYSHIYGNTLSGLRWNKKFQVIKNAGWHFSYLGGVDKIQHKLKSFADTMYNTPKINNKERIEKLLETGEGLYDEKLKVNYIPIDNTFPKCIVENQDYYKQLGFIKE